MPSEAGGRSPASERSASRDAPHLTTIFEQELMVWAALAAGDPEADRRLLSHDFIGVYPSGFAGRDEHADQLADGPTVIDYALSLARLIEVGDDAALLCYRADYRRPGSPSPHAMLVSSLWRRQGAAWINTFSQDTPLPVKVGDEGGDQSGSSRS